MTWREIIVTMTDEEADKLIKDGAEEIVRCRNCKHMLPLQQDSKFSNDIVWCCMNHDGRYGDDFCSLGEWKD